MTLDATLRIRYFGRDTIPETSGWFGLRGELEALGVNVAQPQDQSAPSHILDIEYLGNDEAQWGHTPMTNRFLIASEPATVNPLQFTKHVSNKYFRVLVPSHLYPKHQNTVVWEGGYFNSATKRTLFANDGMRRGCGIINENKFSFVRESNYLLRSKLIYSAIDSGLMLSVAGRNWTRGIAWTMAKLSHHLLIAFRAARVHLRIRDVAFALFFSSQRKRVSKLCVGFVRDSGEFLSNFKVAIVIENESSKVSGKVYDALASGCQCVYVGPPLDPSFFPEGFLFISKPEVSDIMWKTSLALRTAYSITKEDLSKLFQQGGLVKTLDVGRRNSWIAKTLANWIHTQIQPRES